MNYTIEPGDTLSKIAQNHGVSVQEIMDANPKINNPNIIYVGQVIKIPYKDKVDWYTVDKSASDYKDPSGSFNNNAEDDNIDSYCVTCKEKEENPVKTSVVRISLFYDGTLNNRTNASQVREGQRSYDTSESNVARLEAGVNGPSSLSEDHSGNLYIEGIGTTNNEDDSARGYALGTGDTGVTAKGERGIQDLISEFEGFNIPRANQITLYIDFFGFSRGAAAARYSNWFATQSEQTVEKTLTQKGYKITKVTVQFMGLFDTVASYAVDHDNDTDELHLNTLSNVNTVIQLAAAEEHRLKFRLTNINSSGEKGTQLFLPGVHSDVGGGYVDQSNETNLQVLDIGGLHGSKFIERRLNQERTWLTGLGWYIDNELTDDKYWIKLIANRQNIGNAYSFIPLHMMIDMCDLNFNKLTKINHDFRDIELLNRVKQHIDLGVAQGKCRTPSHWWNQKEQDFKDLRHQFLHFSAHYEQSYVALEPHAPQWLNDDDTSENATRQRKIQDG